GLWVGGLRCGAEAGDGRLVVSATRDGADHLALIDADGAYAELETPFTEMAQVVPGSRPGSVLLVASTPVSEARPYEVQLAEDGRPPVIEPLRDARDIGVTESWLSRPVHVSFRSGDGTEERVAHALYYPPSNPEVDAPA